MDGDTASSLLPTASISGNADLHGGCTNGLPPPTGNDDILSINSDRSSSFTMKEFHESDGSKEERKWWQASREFWEALAYAYDTVGSMIVGVAWCYIVPLAALPSEGCPSDDGCWKYIMFLLFYVVFCTAVIPLIIARSVRYFSREVTRLTNHSRDDGTKSKIGLAFFKRSQNLLVMAYSVTWSVGNSNLLYYAVAQLQYQLTDDDDNSGDDDPVPPEVDDTIPPQADDHPPPGPWLDKTMAQSHRFLAWMSDLHHSGHGSGTYGQNGGGGGGGGDGEDNKDDHHFKPSSWDNSGPISDGSTDAGSSEARFKMLGYSLVFAAAYTILAVGFTFGASMWLRRCGCCSRRSYLIELSFLLQNNWYYVVGYGWYLFFSYLWFASLQYSDGSAVLLLMLEVLRALIFSFVFGWLAVYKLPYKVADREEAKDAVAVRAKMRVLLFMTCMVIVVCAQCDVPTYFVNTYLADVTNMSSGAQTALLYVFMVFGVWGLTVFNLKVQKLPEEKKNDVRLDFTMETMSWLVSFLGWTPGKATVVVLSDLVKDWLGDNTFVLIVTQCLLGLLITLVVAIGSTLLHQAGEGVVLDRAKAMSLRALKRLSESIGSMSFSDSMSTLSSADSSGYPGSSGSAVKGNDGAGGGSYQKLAASEREALDEGEGEGEGDGIGDGSDLSGQLSGSTGTSTQRSIIF